MAVVGVHHPNAKGPTRRFAIEALKPGDPVALQPEPKNRADPHAIAVFNSAGVQLGYLTAERAPLIGRYMSEGRPMQTVFQQRSEFGCWIRMALDGEPMQMPEGRSTAGRDGERTVVRDEFDQREFDD